MRLCGNGKYLREEGDYRKTNARKKSLRVMRCVQIAQRLTIFKSPGIRGFRRFRDFFFPSHALNQLSYSTECLLFSLLLLLLFYFLLDISCEYDITTDCDKSEIRRRTRPTTVPKP